MAKEETFLKYDVIYLWNEGGLRQQKRVLFSTNINSYKCKYVYCLLYYPRHCVYIH